MKPKCNCGRDAVYSTEYRTPLMDAPAFWYDCEKCLRKTQITLNKHPGSVFTTRQLAYTASAPVRDRSHTEDYRLQQEQIAARRLK
jgi:hypothetical protein